MSIKSWIVPAAKCYLGLKGIIFSRDIFDYFLINVKVNLELRGFTKLRKSSLPLHIEHGNLEIKHENISDVMKGKGT